MSEAVGAFLVASALITVCGVTGWVETLMKHVPKSLAAGMLAGVLLRFGINVFTSLSQQLALVGLMLGFYLVGRRLRSRYTIPLTFLGGLLWAGINGLIRLDAVDLAHRAGWSMPQLVDIAAAGDDPQA